MIPFHPLPHPVGNAWEHLFAPSTSWAQSPRFRLVVVWPFFASTGIEFEVGVVGLSWVFRGHRSFSIISFKEAVELAQKHRLTVTSIKCPGVRWEGAKGCVGREQRSSRSRLPSTLPGTNRVLWMAWPQKEDHFSHTNQGMASTSMGKDWNTAVLPFYGPWTSQII